MANMSTADEALVQEARRILQTQLAPLAWHNNRWGKGLQEVIIAAHTEVVEHVLQHDSLQASLHRYSEGDIAPETLEKLDALDLLASASVDAAFATAKTVAALAGRNQPEYADQWEETASLVRRALEAGGEAAAATWQNAINQVVTATPKTDEPQRQLLNRTAGRLAAIIRLGTNSAIVQESMPHQSSWLDEQASAAALTG